ncbi:hypothetical protein, partial [Serratia marcescens]|uniref:hypothetical protein n=1 Tax=Serratia marcescens TaxID=615 RepID=UPI000A41316F
RRHGFRHAFDRHVHLSVMLFAFGGSGSLGTADVAFVVPGGATPYSRACEAQIVESLSHSDTVKATFDGRGAAADRVTVVLGNDERTPATGVRWGRTLSNKAPTVSSCSVLPLR